MKYGMLTEEKGKARWMKGRIGGMKWRRRKKWLKYPLEPQCLQGEVLDWLWMKGNGFHLWRDSLCPWFPVLL